MKIAHDVLRAFVADIFAGAGCAPPEDRTIADRLVEANLVGHDSHGVIRVGDYVRYLGRGQVKANQQVEIVVDFPSVLVLDGQQGFGQSIGEQAMRLGIERAKSTGMVSVALRNCGHLGRIGDWPEVVAASGLVSLHFVNTSGFGLLVAPFGGIDRRLSANPIAAGVPRRNDPPIVLDISTCAIAEGKIKVARNRGQTVPENCIIDHDGRPTVDPNRFYADPTGALLPIGGHKGYGLSVITELLAGALTGGGCSDPRNNAYLSNGMLSLIMAPDVFGPRDRFDDEVEQFVAFLKSSRRAEGVDEILLPGEIEQRTRATRLAHGLDIEPVTWSTLVQAARTVGVDRIPEALKED
jgi:hydroxycarboxylate dehydrogenase B